MLRHGPRGKTLDPNWRLASLPRGKSDRTSWTKPLVRQLGAFKPDCCIATLAQRRSDITSWTKPPLQRTPPLELPFARSQRRRMPVLRLRARWPARPCFDSSPAGRLSGAGRVYGMRNHAVFSWAGVCPRGRRAIGMPDLQSSCHPHMGGFCASEETGSRHGCREEGLRTGLLATK